MKNILIGLSICVLSLNSCQHNHAEGDSHAHEEKIEKQDNHGHDHAELEPISYTVYSEKTEVFVEFKPFVKGEKSTLIAHFTKTDGNFKAIEEAILEVTFADQTIAKSKVDSRGIFKIDISTKKIGKFPLSFKLKAKDYTDEIIIKGVEVFINNDKASHGVQYPKEPGIVFLKEQAWNLEFANEEVVLQDFYHIIKTSGEIMPAQGDEQVIVAKTNGIVHWNNSSLIGNKVLRGNGIAKIKSSGLTQNNFNTEYQLTKSEFVKTKINYAKAVLLVQDKIISQIEFQNFKTAYFIAKTNFESLGGDNFLSSKNVTATSNGFIKNLLVNNGDYVEIGQNLAIISENKNLTLKALLPQNHFNQLNNIQSAKFKMSYGETVHEAKELISKSKTLAKGTYQLPLYFKIDNVKEIIPGSLAEVFLKGNKIENAMLVSIEALIEEQGSYSVYVQNSGEGFEKRPVKLGLSDGEKVQILAGLSQGERVVSKGTFQLKLATMSGEMPTHSH